MLNKFSPFHPMEDPNQPLEQDQYNPSANDREIIQHVYSEYRDMRDVMDAKYPEFNDRTLKQFLDDCQKRANSYTPSKSAQGKDEWQANVFTPTTRNKVKALIAAIAKEPPPMHMSAFNSANYRSVKRAEILSKMVESSYVQHGNNPEVKIFFDGWDCAINGTKIIYDGYLRIKNTIKILKDYDPTTGQVEVEEKEEYVADHPIEVDIDPLNLLIKNPYIRDIQDQPAIIWVDYYDKEKYWLEFQHYKNAKFVKTQGEMLSEGDMITFFGDQWKERQEGNMYEVVRYYNKLTDVYYIIVNGVLLLKAPLLWGKRKKVYPFGKTIAEPFAKSTFFWGNSLVNILMAEQDAQNAMLNSMLDKTYRSLETPMLVGMANKDAFDLEDEWVTGDTKIYVDDVNNVKPMPIAQVNQSELAMYKILQSGLERDSTDSVQGGAAGSGSTAREIVIANERAEELKGLFFIFMKDLWLQKYRLRAMNILMNYSHAKVVTMEGEEGAQEFEQYGVFTIPRTELSDGTMGTRQIEVVKDMSALQTPAQLGIREEAGNIEGQPLQITQITSDFLDDHEYEIRLETENMYQKSKALKMAMMDEKIKGVANLFPEIFMANKDQFFKTYMEGYGDDPDKYLENMSPAGMGVGNPGSVPGMQGQPQQGQVGSQLTAPTKSLPMLA